MAEEAGNDSLTRGFLFADLRGYTEYVERHGGEAAARLLARYRSLVRDRVAQFRGAEIKTEGDSFYLVFPSVSAAVRAGLAILDDAAQASAAEPDHPIKVGIGVHAGETIETGEGYVGSPVNIAARLCALARAGELLVSDTVRSLTSTVVRAPFIPRGRQHLKGIAEPIAVFAVSATDTSAVAIRPRRRLRQVAPILVGSIAVVALAAAVWAVAARGPNGPAATIVPQSSSTPSAASASPSPGTSPGLSSREQRLLVLLPLDMAAHCEPAPEEATRLAEATFRCNLPLGSGADTVWWDRFPTRGELLVALDRLLASQGVPDQPCGPDVHEGSGPWSLGTTFSGTRVCWVDDGTAWVAWTYDVDQVLARAARTDGDAAALSGWWDDTAGFLNTR